MSLRVTIVLMSLGLAATVAAQSISNYEARVSGTAVRGFAGRTVNMPWSLQHTGTISGLQFELNFPSNKLMAGTYRHDGLSNNTVLRWRQIAPGQHRVLVYNKSAASLNTNANLGALPFMIPPGDYQGGASVTITNAIVSRTNAYEATPVKLVAGSLYTTPIYRGDDGVVDLLLTVSSNRTYVVQATTNFVSWGNIATNFAAFDYIAVTDTDAPLYSSRFYRAVPVSGTGGNKISNVTVLGGSQMVFGYATTSGKSYVLQASTNLTVWNGITTNFAAGNLLNFTNLITPGVPRQFFRVLELP